LFINYTFMIYIWWIGNATEKLNGLSKGIPTAPHIRHQPACLPISFSPCPAAIAGKQPDFLGKARRATRKCCREDLIKKSGISNKRQVCYPGTAKPWWCFFSRMERTY
jgi:hypothetical protein